MVQPSRAANGNKIASEGKLASMDEAAEFFSAGKAAHQAGLLADAIALYGRAIEKRPDYAEAHNNLGNVLGEAKRHAEAAASLARAAELRPELAAIHSNLGLALARLERFEDAAASHRRALALQPDLAEAHNNLAMALKELGRPEEAITHYRRAIKLKQGFAPFHHNLANALSTLARYDEALSSFQHAIALNPKLAGAHDSLGLALMALDRGEDAVASFRRAIEFDAGQASFHLHLATALQDLEQFAEAEEAYARAVTLAPGMAAAHASRGLALLEAGRRAEALESLERAIAADPAAAPAYYYRQRASEHVPRDSDVATLEALAAASAGKSPDARYGFHFSLADAYEAQGNFDSAFENFRIGNELRRGAVSYNEEAVRERLQRIQRMFTPARLADHAREGSESEQPIFIVGLPRSGSTLLEQILASHPQVAGGGERPLLAKLLAAVRLEDRPPAEFPDYVPDLRPGDLRLLGERYVGLLAANRPPAPRLLDKYLANHAYLGMIAMMLPRARILHIRRDPRDALISAYCQPFSGNAQPQSYDLGELGRHYRLYAGMMEHWRKTLVEGSLLEVRYEALVDDLEGSLRPILDYCGLPWDERCLTFHETRRPVRSASLTQVRRRLYRSSIGRWRHFEAHLGPLFEALGPDSRD
jgi:tetratricopeptide (TPR) repeat protein